MSDFISRNEFMKLAGLGMGSSFFGLNGLGTMTGKQNPVSPFGVPKGVHSRWTSPENSTGTKGMGARSNKGGKGHAFDIIPVGESVDLLNVESAGVVNRIKLTTSNRTPRMLRSLRIDMYWDGASKPAVSSPLGDFFGIGLGRTAAFESDFFSNPEGRSFNCFIPMPFKKGARITITNESEQKVNHLFYNVNYQVWDEPINESLYFHGYWNRNQSTELGRDYQILPPVEGKGLFLGTNIGVEANPIYEDIWWGEGEVKIYLDGDAEYPTLAGTGTEDYIGTAWGQGVFDNRYQGATIANEEQKLWTFYRYHIPDPIYFHDDIKVTIQQIGGGPLKQVRSLIKKNAPLKLVSVDQNGSFIPLLESSSVPDIMDDSFPEGWVNFYRRDDWSSMAYFYLSEPENNLPALPPVDRRTKALRVSNDNL